MTYLTYVAKSCLLFILLTDVQVLEGPLFREIEARYPRSPYRGSLVKRTL